MTDRVGPRRRGSRARLLPAWLRASVVLSVLLWPALQQPLAAQIKPADPAITKDDEDVLKAGLKDPYTDGDPKAMAAAGIVAYGPFAWADEYRTTDVDRVLGEQRILWVETAHFRIGCNLATTLMPVAADKKKWVLDELKRLKKKLPKIDDKPKKLEPWLRVHLYAQRAEELYADFQQLLGVTDAAFGDGKEVRQGKYLGLPDKFLLLLFQKKSDLARYLDRFCGVQAERSYRHYHQKSRQMLSAISAQGLGDADDLGILSHTIYSLTNNLVNGYQGFCYDLPLWFSEGVAHWFSRRIPSDFVNIVPKADEVVADEKQHEWGQRVRRRAQFEGTWLKFAQLDAVRVYADLGFQEHTMAWSRVDYLMNVDRAKVGIMLRELKGLPLPVYGAVKPEAVRQLEAALLQQLFDLDPASFDQRWREWVLKTYPKK